MEYIRNDEFINQYNNIERAIADSFVVDCLSVSGYNCSVDTENFIKYIQKFSDLPVFRKIAVISFDEEGYEYWFEEFLQEENSRYHKMLKSIYRQRKKEIADCNGKINAVSYACGNVICSLFDEINKDIFNVAKGEYFEDKESDYYKQALQTQDEYETINNEIKENNRKSLLALNEQSNLLGDILSEDPEFRKCSSAIRKWNYLIHYISSHEDEYPELCWWESIPYSASNPECRRHTDFLASISQKYYRDYWKKAFNYEDDDE